MIPDDLIKTGPTFLIIGLKLPMIVGLPNVMFDNMLVKSYKHYKVNIFWKNVLFQLLKHLSNMELFQNG